jgi:hypothetical protein
MTTASSARLVTAVSTGSRQTRAGTTLAGTRGDNVAHPLRGKLAIDVDDQIGVGNIGGIRVDGRDIDVAFFDPRDPRVTPKLLDTWRGFGKLAGIRYVLEWDKDLAPEAAAKKASDYITALEKDGKRRVDVVEWDVETHDHDRQLRFLLGSREEQDNGSWLKGIRGAGGYFPGSSPPQTYGYRWGRPGVWTMEGRQDATTSAADYAATSGLLVGPQLYDGDMTECWDLWYEIQTWCLNANPERPNGARIPIGSLIPYYDVRKALRPSAVSEAILFATSRAA